MSAIRPTTPAWLADLLEAADSNDATQVYVTEGSLALLDALVALDVDGWQANLPTVALWRGTHTETTVSTCLAAVESALAWMDSNGGSLFFDHPTTPYAVELDLRWTGAPVETVRATFAIA